MSHSGLNNYLETHRPEITATYQDKNCDIVYEGYSGQIPEESLILARAVSSTNIKDVLEIGFNAGHSAVTLLANNPHCNVTSIDLGWHPYTKYGKQYVDIAFPGRHKLLIGDSTKVVLEQALALEGKKYDLIFIDGGHDFPIAKHDLVCSQLLAHTKTILLMDDVVENKENITGWSQGPTSAWNLSVEAGVVVQYGIQTFAQGRGIAWGIYNFEKA